MNTSTVTSKNPGRFGPFLLIAALASILGFLYARFIDAPLAIHLLGGIADGRLPQTAKAC